MEKGKPAAAGVAPPACVSEYLIVEGVKESGGRGGGRGREWLAFCFTSIRKAVYVSAEHRI